MYKTAFLFAVACLFSSCSSDESFVGQWTDGDEYLEFLTDSTAILQADEQSLNAVYEVLEGNRIHLTVESGLLGMNQALMLDYDREAETLIYSRPGTSNRTEYYRIGDYIPRDLVGTWELVETQYYLANEFVGLLPEPECAEISEVTYTEDGALTARTRVIPTPECPEDENVNEGLAWVRGDQLYELSYSVVWSFEWESDGDRLTLSEAYDQVSENDALEGGLFDRATYVYRNVQGR